VSKLRFAGSDPEQQKSGQVGRDSVEPKLCLDSEQVGQNLPLTPNHWPLFIGFALIPNTEGQNLSALSANWNVKTPRGATRLS
jgi:hypothetical protein